jgi:predicted dehydrogenase
MKKSFRRRHFIKLAAIGGSSLFFSKRANGMFQDGKKIASGTRVGIIGLDVSHSVAFTKLLNSADAPPAFGGYKVVAAYPKGSNDIAVSVNRIPEFTKAVAEMGVEIVSSIDDLLTKVDVVLLNTNDGRLHLEQVLPVLKAGKRVFIDKPFAASLSDVAAIFNLSKKDNVPVFSSSSMRYMANAQMLTADKIGAIIGVDTYSPSMIEKTHADLFWYGVHGVEMLYTLMGTGCLQVQRVYTPDTDVVTGIWPNGRIGTFRGTRTGPHNYGGTVFGEKAISIIQPAKGFDSLMVEIIHFFQTGIPPVSPAETLELYAFMEAADESKRRGGAAVTLAETLKKIKIDT